jgi:hypothetical protein
VDFFTQFNSSQDDVLHAERNVTVAANKPNACGKLALGGEGLALQ